MRALALIAVVGRVVASDLVTALAGRPTNRRNANTLLGEGGGTIANLALATVTLDLGSVLQGDGTSSLTSLVLLMATRTILLLLLEATRAEGTTRTSGRHLATVLIVLTLHSATRSAIAEAAVAVLVMTRVILREHGTTLGTLADDVMSLDARRWGDLRLTRQQGRHASTGVTNRLRKGRTTLSLLGSQTLLVGRRSRVKLVLVVAVCSALLADVTIRAVEVDAEARSLTLTTQMSRLSSASRLTGSSSLSHASTTGHLLIALKEEIGWGGVGDAWFDAASSVRSLLPDVSY
jgi:hypothetical protein